MNEYSDYYMTDSTASVKKRARRAVNLVAVSALISTALSYIFMLLLSSFVLPLFNELIIKLLTENGESRIYAVTFAGSFLHSSELNFFIQIIRSIFCTFIPFAVMAKLILKMNPGDAAPMKGEILGTFPFIYCAVLMMASAVSGTVGSIFSFLFPDAYGNAPTDTVSIYGESSEPAALVLCFLAMCVVAPLVEEFVYRGIMFGYLRKFGFSFAAFSSSLIFGLAHATVEQVAYAFVSGMIFCLVVEKTGNLKTGILIHFLNNFIGYTDAYLIPLSGSETAAVVFNTVYNIFAGIFAVIGMIVLFKKGGLKPCEEAAGKEAPDEEPERASVNAPISCFFCVGSIFVILSSVFNLLLGMQ